MRSRRTGRDNSITRKIWTKHHGQIPFDEFGLRHEIHHIDGDHTNNDITNLACLTVHEHYEIHFWQEDWQACKLILGKLYAPPGMIAEMNRLSGLKNRGQNHPNFDHTLYSFTNCTTHEIVVMTQLDFANRFNLSRIHVGNVVRETRMSVRGWRLTKNIDKKLQGACIDIDMKYRWRHRQSDQIVIATRYEMSERFFLSKGHLLSVVKKERHSVGGWELDTGKSFAKSDSPKKDQTLYEFHNKHTNETVVMSRDQLAEKIGLTLGGIGHLIRNKGISESGWHLAELQFSKKRKQFRRDDTLYRLEHTQTKHIIVANRYDLRELCELAESNVNALISGAVNTAKGWRLIRK